jgi:hypothetical protein
LVRLVTPEPDDFARSSRACVPAVTNGTHGDTIGIAEDIQGVLCMLWSLTIKRPLMRPEARQAGVGQLRFSGLNRERPDKKIRPAIFASSRNLMRFLNGLS